MKHLNLGKNKKNIVNMLSTLAQRVVKVKVWFLYCVLQDECLYLQERPPYLKLTSREIPLKNTLQPFITRFIITQFWI